jgi:RHS repeat-associated protein
VTYNKVNQMTGLTRFSDLVGTNLVAETSYTYDQNQRLVQLAHKKGATNLVSYDYTHDSANRLTKINSSVDGATDYTYDSTNQLTGAEHSSQTDEAYQYDANGNRINSGYQTGANNQLLADGQFTYQYDQEGNRTKRTEVATGKVTEYVWDYRNRLSGVVIKDAAGGVVKSIEYTYDVDNQRIGKKIDTSASLSTGGVVTERYVIDRDQIALVFDGQGIQKARYLYGTEIDQVIAEESTAGVHWFLADEQGTIKDVVNNTGTVIDHITYDSFGRIVNQTSAIDLRFAYTGREWDGETGQYYYRARYYDPMVGRFVSEDPLGFGAGDTNVYRYVDNSPTNHTDPSGKIFWVPVVLVVAGYVAAQALFPKNAQTPTSACDNHPTPPDQELKQDLTELVVGGVDAVPSLVRGFGKIAGKVAGREAAEAAAMAAERRAAEAAADAATQVSCFVAGTMIQTIDGEKAIEDIKIGDWVLSDDPNTPGGIEYKQVLQTFNHDTTNLVDIYINGEKITTTETHPFWVHGVGWVAAKDLNVGTLLQTKNESWLDIDKVEKHIGLTKVYNFEVAGFHTYFVSDLGLLVHNNCDEEFLRRAADSLQNSTMRTQQEFVSGGRIQKYEELLRQGVDLGPIKVDGNIIVDGHHRYVASQLAGVELRQVPGVRPSFKLDQPSLPIGGIKISPFDY